MFVANKFWNLYLKFSWLPIISLIFQFDSWSRIIRCVFIHKGLFQIINFCFNFIVYHTIYFQFLLHIFLVIFFFSDLYTFFFFFCYEYGYIFLNIYLHILPHLKTEQWNFQSFGKFMITPCLIFHYAGLIFYHNFLTYRHAFVYILK